jgi:hypothetical protein
MEAALPPPLEVDHSAPSVVRLGSVRYGSAVLVLGSLLLSGGCVRHTITSAAHEYRLGDTLIESVLYRAQGSDLLLFNLHENESTSVEAALHLIRRRGGQVLALHHSGEREITFLLSGHSFSFDPNRIFTDSGAAATVSPQGPSRPEAVTVVRDFAKEIVSTYSLDSSSAIVTLHNNTDGAYSAESYLPEGQYALDARKVFVDRSRDPDDFFFVTDASLFTRLSRSGFNVVLQNNRFVTDDGSLSVLAARRGIPYVNVEAQHGHRKAQEKMLRALLKVLRKRTS